MSVQERQQPKADDPIEAFNSLWRNRVYWHHRQPTFTVEVWGGPEVNWKVFEDVELASFEADIPTFRESENDYGRTRVIATEDPRPHYDETRMLEAGERAVLFRDVGAHRHGPDDYLDGRLYGAHDCRRWLVTRLEVHTDV